MTTTTTTTSFITRSLTAMGIDTKATDALKTVGGDVQNLMSETVTTTAYVIGSVTRSASTLATATRMGAEATYNALPSDREAVEQGINDLIASAKLAMTDLNEMDTQTKPKFGTKQSVTEQADNGIS